MEGLLWLLVFGGLFYVMMRWGCGAHAVHGHGAHGGHAERGPSAEGAQAGRAVHSTTNARDPVCGMTVDGGSSYHRSYEGREYRFCSEQCRRRFDADPAHYSA